MAKFLISEKNKDRIFICLMLLLPITHFLVFWLYIKGSAIIIAFQNEFTGEFSLEHFERFFRQFRVDMETDGVLKGAIANTFISAGIGLLINMPLAVFSSFVLYKKFYGHNFFMVVFYLPGIFGTVICIMMTKFVLDTTGPIVSIGRELGIKWIPEVVMSGLLNNNTTGRTTYFVTMLSIGGGTILLLRGALQKIPRDLFDVGKIEGMGFFREFWYVAVPCSWSTIGIMWIMGFASVWGEYSRSYLLTGGAYGTCTLGYYLFARTLASTTGNESYNYPAAVGLILTAIVLPLTLLLRWGSTKVVKDVEF